jgi:enoyl-CoA hydratase/carnithine racemase
MPHWEVEPRGAIAVLTFTRPPRNFMSFAAMGELGDRLEELADRDDVSVIVLTGGVPGYFVAHADLDDLARLGRGEPVTGDPASWGRTLARIESLPQPVVAAINGQAWGGGCELSLACTLRVAAASAHLGQPEVSVGIIPGAGGTQRLPRLVGPGRAAELILSGRVVQADEARAVGLVEACLPDDRFVDRVVEWLQPMATKPRRALVAAKRAVIEGLRLPFDEGLRLEGRLFVECQLGGEAVALEEAALRRYDEAPPDAPVTL